MKNLTIAKRLALGFGLVVLLLIAVSWLGISRMGELHDSLDDITKDKWKKVTLLKDGLAGVNEIGLGARDMTLAASKTDQQAAKERVLAGRTSIGKAWETLKPMLNQPKGKEFFEKIMESRAQFIDNQN